VRVISKIWTKSDVIPSPGIGKR